MSCNKIQAILSSFCLGVFFSACGSENGDNPASVSEVKTQVSTKYELGACDAHNASSTMFVIKENAYYHCNGSEWKKMQDDVENATLPDANAIGLSSSVMSTDSEVQQTGYVFSSSSSNQDPPIETLSCSNQIYSSSSNILIKSSSSKNALSSSARSELSSSSVKYDSLTDSRDGQIYKTVRIGTQIWMAENLNYEAIDSYCYENKIENCKQFGRRYYWETAITVCPSGWHLPTLNEWAALTVAVGGDSIAGKVLKSTEGWKNNGNGDDSYGFSILPDVKEAQATFWTLSENQTYIVTLYNRDDLRCSVNENQNYSASVRCLKGKSTYILSSSSFAQTAISSSYKQGESSSSTITITTGTMTDSRDKKTYKTITIGHQTWMAENLNYLYPKGDSSSYCPYNKQSYCTKYGRLYSWNAATKACPSGWHLPTKTEWAVLDTLVAKFYYGTGYWGRIGQHWRFKSSKEWSKNGDNNQYRFRSLTEWDGCENSNDFNDFGFSVLPAGEGYITKAHYGAVVNNHEYTFYESQDMELFFGDPIPDGENLRLIDVPLAFFWTSKEDEIIYFDCKNKADGSNFAGTSRWLSVRCLKD